MSIWNTTYLLYGFKLEKQKEIDTIDDHYEELMEEEPYSDIFDNEDSDQVLVYDGMCGNYVYIGLKLASIEEDEDDPFVNISEDDVHNLKDKLLECMKNWPDYITKLTKNYKPELYMFIHSS